MATRSKYFCELCEKIYDFKSRYDRHLASAGHRNLEEFLNHQPVDETSDPAVEQEGRCTGHSGSAVTCGAVTCGTATQASVRDFTHFNIHTDYSQREYKTITCNINWEFMKVV